VFINVRPKAIRKAPMRRSHRSWVCLVCTGLITSLQLVRIFYHEIAVVGQDPHPITQDLPSYPIEDKAVVAGPNYPSEGESAAAGSSSGLAKLTIPKLIHQSWRDGGFPKDMFNWRWQAGLETLNPDWKLMHWTDESSRQLIASEYPWFLKTYDAYPSYIQRCDAARYFIIYHHGGVYADLDMECFRPFEPVIAGKRVVLSYKQGTNMSRGLVNAIFASEPRHPFWSTVFALLVNRSNEGAHATTHVDVVRSTGPGLLRAAVEQMWESHRLSTLGVALMHSRVWHPIMPEQKRGRDSSLEVQQLINQSACYHHFVSSWIQHSRERHNATDTTRRRAGRATTLAPTGQGIRSQNTWRSFQVNQPAGELIAT